MFKNIFLNIFLIGTNLLKKNKIKILNKKIKKKFILTIKIYYFFISKIYFMFFCKKKKKCPFFSLKFILIEKLLILALFFLIKKIKN